MKIAIFERTAQNSGEIAFLRDGLAPGFRAAGDQVEFSLEKYASCDVAVILWSPRNGWPERARAARAVRNLHGPDLLIVETPLFRGLSGVHYRVGFDHVHRGGRFYEGDTARAKQLGLAPKPWRGDEGAIVIAGQVPGDFSLDGLDSTEWALDVATYLERHGVGPLVLRPHPFDHYSDWAQISSSLGVEISRRPLTEDLSRAARWVALTSGSAVDAVMAGVPTICLSPQNFAWDVASHHLSELDAPFRGPRENWLAKLSGVQWTEREIASGQCWRFLRPLTEAHRTRKAMAGIAT